MHLIPADTENQVNGGTMGHLQEERTHVPQEHLGHLAPTKFARVEFYIYRFSNSDSTEESPADYYIIHRTSTLSFSLRALF